jgi:hypothetical protein
VGAPQQQWGQQQQPWGQHQQQWGQPQWGAQPGYGQRGTDSGKTLRWVLIGGIAAVIIVGLILLIFLR